MHACIYVHNGTACPVPLSRRSVVGTMIGFPGEPPANGTRGWVCQVKRGAQYGGAASGPDLADARPDRQLVLLPDTRDERGTGLPAQEDRRDPWYPGLWRRPLPAPPIRAAAAACHRQSSAPAARWSAAKTSASASYTLCLRDAVQCSLKWRPASVLPCRGSCELHPACCCSHGVTRE